MSNRNYRSQFKKTNPKTGVLFLFLFLLIGCWYPHQIEASSGISVSPIILSWDAQKQRFEVDYTIYNNSGKRQDISSIVVFKAEKFKRWRGIPARNFDNKTQIQFIRTLSPGFLLKTDYIEIAVYLYLGDYERFVFKSSSIQALSSKSVLEDKIEVIVSEQMLAQEGVTQQKPSIRTYNLGMRKDLPSLFTSKQEAELIVNLLTGEKTETAAEAIYKLETGNYFITLESKHLGLEKEKSVKPIVLEVNDQALSIKNPEHSLSFTGTKIGNEILFSGMTDDMSIEFSGKLIADNQIKGNAVQKSGDDTIYTAQFAVSKEKP